MAEITIATVPDPSVLDWYGWPWAWAGPETTPTLDLLSATPDGLDLVLLFNRPPAGDVLDPASYTLATLGDYYLPAIVAVALEPVPPGETYPFAVRLTLGAQTWGGGGYTVTVADLVGPCDEPLGINVATWTGVATAPRLLSADLVDTEHVLLTFDTPMELFADPVVELIDGAPVAVASVTAPTPTTMLVHLAAAVVPAEEYSVTAPADATDISGNTIDAAHRVGTFSTWDTPETEGVLEALTGILGEMLAEMAGTPTTRLTEALASGGATAHVESTMGFEAAGRFRIGERTVEYAGRTIDSLTGLVWPPYCFDTFDPGTPVEDDNGLYSIHDRLRAEAGILTCPDDAIDATAQDYGFPRPLAEMAADDVRHYAATLYYLDRGTWYAVFRVLRYMYRWAAHRGTTGAYSSPVLTVPVSQCPEEVEDLHDRWCYIDGRLCRIVNAVLATVDGVPSVQMTMEGIKTPFCQAAPAGDATVVWELLAFRLEETTRNPLRVAYLKIILYVPGADLSGTYLLESGPADDANRPRRGKLAADWTSEEPHEDDGGGFQSLYLTQPYRQITLDVINEVVAGGVQVEVATRIVAS